MDAFVYQYDTKAMPWVRRDCDRPESRNGSVCETVTTRNALHTFEGVFRRSAVSQMALREPRQSARACQAGARKGVVESRQNGRH